MTDWNSREGARKGHNLARKRVQRQAEQRAENVGPRRFKSGERAVDRKSIIWETPLELNVWAGNRLLTFELADPRNQTVRINRDAGWEH